jgi:outer membrane lipoprotein SlyB
MSYLIWAGAQEAWVFALFALWFGLSYGSIVSLLPAICMDLFGGRAVSAIIGTLYTGAALGNQVGGGSGRDIATAAGAVIGYQIGRGESQPGGVTYRTVCESVPITTQRGETVTFRYRGRLFSQTFE